MRDHISESEAKLEAKLEELATELARKTGCITFKIAPTHVGLPDRCVIGPTGHIMLVELKTETGHLRPAQREWIGRAQRQGAPVFVTYGEAQLRAFFNQASVVPATIDDLRLCDPPPGARTVGAKASYRRELVARESGILGLLCRELARTAGHSGVELGDQVTVVVETDGLA